MDAKLILCYINATFVLFANIFCAVVGDFLQKLNKHFCNVRECLGIFFYTRIQF
jgi:hypothetical protein